MSRRVTFYPRSRALLEWLSDLTFESETLSSLLLSSSPDFSFFNRSSACRRHRASRSFRGILLYLGSGLRRDFAVDHELRTVFPLSVSLEEAASGVTTSDSSDLNSWVHLCMTRQSYQKNDFQQLIQIFSSPRFPFSFPPSGCLHHKY